MGGARARAANEEQICCRAALLACHSPQFSPLIFHTHTHSASGPWGWQLARSVVSRFFPKLGVSVLLTSVKLIERQFGGRQTLDSSLAACLPILSIQTKNSNNRKRIFSVTGSANSIVLPTEKNSIKLHLNYD